MTLLLLLFIDPSASSIHKDDCHSLVSTTAIVIIRQELKEQHLSGKVSRVHRYTRAHVNARRRRRQEPLKEAGKRPGNVSIDPSFSAAGGGFLLSLLFGMWQQQHHIKYEMLRKGKRKKEKPH